MRIDCATCPGRGRACEDCVMQVLFEPLTSIDGDVDEWSSDTAWYRNAEQEINAALDVFVATSMISEYGATLAKRSIGAGDGHRGQRSRRMLRAV